MYLVFKEERVMNKKILKTIVSLVFYIIISCSSSDDEPNPPAIKKCGTSEKTIKQGFKNEWSRIVELPASGKFVEESHYITNKDFISGGWPTTKSELIDKHLQRSFEIYKKYDSNVNFDELYNRYWQKEWTPEEGGHFGQGSVGEIQKSELSPEMEMWFMTMMWASSSDRPARGTKFLLQANEKSVVVIAGYETGPGSESKLGGVTREVHKWLETNNSSIIKVSYLNDQKSNIGPIDCK